MNSDSITVLCITIIIILCLGEPDLLDSLIAYLQSQTK